MPGCIGNPGGRPKADPEVKEILKAGSPDAARALVGLLKSKRENIRLQAACEILDRTQGKPEAMSKVQLSTPDDTKIIFQWITDDNDTNNKTSIQTATTSAGNTPDN